LLFSYCASAEELKKLPVSQHGFSSVARDSRNGTGKVQGGTRASISNIPDRILEDGLLKNPGSSVCASSGDTQTPAGCKA